MAHDVTPSVSALTWVGEREVATTLILAPVFRRRFIHNCIRKRQASLVKLCAGGTSILEALGTMRSLNCKRLRAPPRQEQGAVCGDGVLGVAVLRGVKEGSWVLGVGQGSPRQIRGVSGKAGEASGRGVGGGGVAEISVGKGRDRILVCLFRGELKPSQGPSLVCI